MNNINKLCEKFYNSKKLSLEEFKFLMDLDDPSDLYEYARKLSVKNFGNKIYIRGLIEISTYCKNNCYYCGLRKANANVKRLRLSKEEILARVEYAKRFNINTVVLQGGEDDFYSISYLEEIIREIKKKHDSTALTLSLGERSINELKKLKEIGADRYLLRHETNSKSHYNKLHPNSMSFENRLNTIFKLKEMGFQTGCGMMIGSPYQTLENLYKDLNLILELKPQMVGIGPFIPNKNTPFRDYPAGKLKDVLKVLSIVRIANERVLLPATTALGSIHETGREFGILAGANVLMPNLGDEKIRKNYTLYDNKIGTQIENSDDFIGLSEKLKKIGYEISTSRGDYEREKEDDV